MNSRRRVLTYKNMCCLTVTASTTDPGILVLVAGDGDYEPAISEAIKFNWTIEVWFWSSGDMVRVDHTWHVFHL
ncbi:4561_t:CDS:2 [Diversispora eburnea]|uniref:4561_t:CDS:1 n=1 Tax=Diversispora eburnea TaxID=1213867 RepID=A0A9N9BPG6_9GLOM|nr:4561_t:CDS:2 [Diversispora eburnea]